MTLINVEGKFLEFSVTRLIFSFCAREGIINLGAQPVEYLRFEFDVCIVFLLNKSKCREILKKNIHNNSRKFYIHVTVSFIYKN